MKFVWALQNSKYTLQWPAVRGMGIRKWQQGLERGEDDKVIKYQEYQISDDRREVLKTLTKMFLDNLQEQTAKYENDPLSTLYGVHVTGTEDLSWQSSLAQSEAVFDNCIHIFRVYKKHIGCH